MTHDLTTQRQLLDRLVLAGYLSVARYLAARTAVADVPARRAVCANHAHRQALVFGPDHVTPLCGPCGFDAHAAEGSAAPDAEVSALKERTADA